MVKNGILVKARALSDTGAQPSDFDYDSHDWGCLRYQLELWCFLNRLRKRDGARGCRDLLNTTLIAYIHDCMNFESLDRFHVVLFTKCYFGNPRFPRMSKEMNSQKFIPCDKKIHRTATKWAGFNLMLYVLYGLGFVNILEDLKVEKRSKCVYTPLQISLAYIVKMILGFKNAYCLDEELEDDVFLQMICTLDGDRTPSKSTLDDDIRRYKAEELQKAYRTIIQWMRALGFVTGATVACDSTKMRVDGLTYEGAEEVFDYQKKENVRGYKLFVIYDVVYRIPIYFEVRGINDADAPPLKEMVKKAKQITGTSINEFISRAMDTSEFVKTLA